MSFRSYREVTGDDRSGLADQVAAQRRRIADRLAAVHQVVAVLSGKGGVGKSYLAAAVAKVAARRCAGAVGVLDADLRSPTVAQMLGARGPLRVTEDGVAPASGTRGVRVVSTGLLLDDGQPLRWREPQADRFVWRGALEVGVLREFLADVQWGALELLLVDLPPGADGVADLAELVPDLTGSVVVTIPTEESRRSVERTMRAAVDAGIRLLGVVENMSGYHCPDCGVLRPLFQGTAGDDLAREFGVPLLGRVPFLTGDALSAAESAVSTVLDGLIEGSP